MTQLLIRLFVKNYKNVDNIKVRTSYGILASIVGIISNILLFAIKITIGLILNSISVMADAFNNLSDVGSFVICFIGARLAGRPADQEHPFGHGRLEYIAALVVSFIILQVGFLLLHRSFVKVLNPEEIEFSWILIVILSMTVLLKLWLSLFNKNLGKAINSNVLKATSIDSLNDVLVTSAAIIALIVGQLTGLNIDGWMGMVVSVFVLFAGFNIAKTTLLPLLGESVSRDIYNRITSKVESYAGIIGSHDLIAHNYGPSHTMATIHAEVSNDLNMEEIHEIIDKIERDVLREMGIFLVIHMDPVEVNDKSVLEKQNIVVKIVEELDPEATIHDFRVMNGEDSTYLVFDLVVPHSYNDNDEQILMMRITERVDIIYNKCRCVITIEKDYIARQ
ncbi:MAG TPA: cation diffusion facilitator family transporter [Candidatus Limnocylindrales bacterium]|nr:cation diffusion facilitator family transporter [Candidatus Limnocylindrales bacterium]